ncbi:hypothetical protein E4U23_005565 [Claviceps purpurea]|nr:hypothetical protein E4U23_005565 [Claviceps purpurea]
MASMTPYTLPVLKPPTAMGSCRWSLVLSPTGGSPTMYSIAQGTSEGKRARRSDWDEKVELGGSTGIYGVHAKSAVPRPGLYYKTSLCTNQATRPAAESSSVELVSAAPPFASSDIDAASFWAPELIFFCVELPAEP